MNPIKELDSDVYAHINNNGLINKVYVIKYIYQLKNTICEPDDILCQLLFGIFNVLVSLILSFNPYLLFLLIVFMTFKIKMWFMISYYVWNDNYGYAYILLILYAIKWLLEFTIFGWHVYLFFMYMLGKN
jgi:hypothetical protein